MSIAEPVTEIPRTKRFAPGHPWDRNFYLLLIALGWLGILRGFGGEIADHVAKHQAAFAIIVHVHAVVFVTWLVLFTVQLFLVRVKKLSTHMKLGFAMVWLMGVMAILGPATALTVQHRAMANSTSDPAFLSVQFTDILAFVSLTAAALIARKKPSAHKRLMLIGTLYITDAGFARWLADPLLHSLGMGYWAFWIALYGAPDVLIALLGVYDLATRRRLHPAYVVGVVWIFSVQMLALSLYFSPTWVVYAKRMIAAWPG